MGAGFSMIRNAIQVVFIDDAATEGTVHKIRRDRPLSAVSGAGLRRCPWPKPRRSPAAFSRFPPASTSRRGKRISAICSGRGNQRSLKGHHPIAFRTPFGTLRLDSERVRCRICPCTGRQTNSVSPMAELLNERVSSEMLYLETKFASLVSYGLTVPVLDEVLLFDRPIGAERVRRHICRVAKSPKRRRLNLHRRLRTSRTTSGAGRIPRCRTDRCSSAWKAAMSAAGCRLGLRRLRARAWSHSIAMDECRIPLAQMTKGAWAYAVAVETKAGALERIKWLLWHGNAPTRLDNIECLADDVADLEENPTSASLRKLATMLGEFVTYITNNIGHIVNYGERFRADERISTGFVESAVNQIVDKRFDKRQSVRWTPRGAHLLLQTRTPVLNGDLDQLIRSRYPAFRKPERNDLAPVL